MLQSLEFIAFKKETKIIFKVEEERNLSSFDGYPLYSTCFYLQTQMRSLANEFNF